MTCRYALALACCCVTMGSAFADPPKVVRTIAKEPAYKTSPKYALLAFGPDGKDRVWLVLDGDRLFVDRNGNGDLTEPGECVERDKTTNAMPTSFSFSVGKLAVGGRTHHRLRLHFRPLRQYDWITETQQAMKAILDKNPDALVAFVWIEVEVPGMKGGGEDGRLMCVAGPFDAKGPLVFAERREDAPVIRLGAGLEIGVRQPSLSFARGRLSEISATVGTAGIGNGTFASLDYTNTIPEAAQVVAELFVADDKAGAKAPVQRFELKERC
jgi:hypothetical protein